jgi:hypothetical protein
VEYSPIDDRFVKYIGSDIPCCGFECVDKSIKLVCNANDRKSVSTFYSPGADSFWDVFTFRCFPSSLLFSDNGAELKLSGRIITTRYNLVIHTVGPQTRVEINGKNVILYEEETVAGKIIASDSSKTLEWKDWILSVQNNLRLPKGERLKTGTGIMTRYKSDWLQVMNITRSAKAEYLPKNALNLVMYYIYK